MRPILAAVFLLSLSNIFMTFAWYAHLKELNHRPWFVAALVSWGLAQLRRGHADVLEAFYFDGKSVREIAGERQTSERAIEGRLRRAREKLKKNLEKVLKPAATRGVVISERIDHA